MKSNNILLTKHGVAKVADVGLASMIDAFSSGAGVYGNFAHAAPEVLFGDKCTTKVGPPPWLSGLFKRPSQWILLNLGPPKCN